LGTRGWQTGVEFGDCGGDEGVALVCGEVVFELEFGEAVGEGGKGGGVDVVGCEAVVAWWC
jgi:hypothetical protein